MKDFARYIPIEKIDAEQRMVWGYASTQALDSQGERVSVKAIEEALPDYMRFGNVREMHQPSAVGKTKSAAVDETGLYIGVKVVDEIAWTKVKEGVYSGFSIGGKRTAKVDDTVTGLRLIEISLVDRPANPQAVFDVWKVDGQRHGGAMGIDLKKWGGPESGTEEDVAKVLDSAKAATDKAVAEMKATLEKNAALVRELADVKSAASQTLVLQAENEELKKSISDREEKDKAERMKKLLDSAQAAGKFRAEKRPNWEKVFSDAGETTCASLLKDAPVVVPIGQRIGSGGDGEESTEARCEKIIEKIMADEKVSYDVAYSKAASRNTKLFQQRDNEQRVASREIGATFGGDDSGE